MSSDGMADPLKKAALLSAAVVVLLAFFVCLLPEPPGRLLTSPGSWEIDGDPASRVLLRDMPKQWRQIRRSTVESGELFRTWTPANGITPLSASSAPFTPARFMAVIIHGGNRTVDGAAQVYFQCEANGQRRDVFRGGVNVQFAEALVQLPENWCPGTIRLKLVATSQRDLVGVGSVVEISRLSYVKAGFLGRLPYFFTALAVFAGVMLAGVAMAERWHWRCDALPVALTSLGVAALALVYLSSSLSASGVPARRLWIGTLVMVAVVVFSLLWSGRQARARAVRALAPYAGVWALVSLVYFSLLCLATNGVGHWEPNYRFWPATWSSDNELPWMFAEAIRHGRDLHSLYGGGWLPTDRPPLMAGAHLLLVDVFALLQSGNDGNWLRGQAYNAAAVVLNALWAPAAWWLLLRLRSATERRGGLSIMALVGCQPVVLFNTLYGWPKAFGASFALVAFGLAWRAGDRDSGWSVSLTLALFFALCAFSMLAHASTALFLAPLGLLLLWRLRGSPRAALPGLLGGLALALGLWASWSGYKALVLPSADPVTKLALTGDYGFDRPGWTLWQMLAERYGAMDIRQWLQIKATMALEAFLPLPHPIPTAQVGLNVDAGAGAIDTLRAWDFLLLSKGNLALPFFVLLAAWAAASASRCHRTAPGGVDALPEREPFLALIGISVAAWLLLVVGFLVPPIVHVWPLAALFGLALGGAVVAHDRYPRIFQLTLLMGVTYTGVVWIASPLRSALAIDGSAAVALLAMGAWGLSFRRWPGLARWCAHFRSARPGDDASADTASRSAAGARLRPLLADPAAAMVVLRATALGALLFAAYIALRYLHQPLADVHAFRQTQTALTSYWMLEEGWRLAYQTPVAGFPWSIPFEFPLYQAMAAAITAVSGLDLGAAGRLTSFLFLVACAWPAFALRRRLQWPPGVPWVFCALLWSSPLYLYWGRTFMIETAALFFALACIPFAFDVMRRVGGWRSLMLFVVLASAGMLQKATTAGPVLILLSLAAAWMQAAQTGLSLMSVRRLLYPAVVFFVPLALGAAWAYYADSVKAANPFGVQLTAKALKAWNFGSLAQRLDWHTWYLVVWQRSLVWNVGGALGLLLLALPWLGWPRQRRFAWQSLATLLAFVLPVLIFTKLHIVHEYYQVACVAFLLAAVAIVVGGWLGAAAGMPLLPPLVTLIMVAINIGVFNSAYGIVAARSLDALHPQSVQAYRVGRYLRERTPPHSALVVFGQGYSSEVAFQAQRKSMTVPPWFADYEKLWNNPQAYVGGLELGAIVICPLTDAFPGRADIEKRMIEEPTWVRESVQGCELLLAPTTAVTR